MARPVRKLKQRWREYQGARNWDGLLDPLDDNLRSEILRYGNFVDVAYKAFDFDTSSTSYGCCKYPKRVVFDRCGVAGNGYRVTKHLYATSGIKMPRWTEKSASWMATRSSWIGYVAVCQDEREIARLGRRDVVIAFRGTATCLEWIENLRATLTFCGSDTNNRIIKGDEPKVESGFLSLYTSGSESRMSLQQFVRDEITRIIGTYNNEPLSVTVTGHSLGAALATLTAYDIKKTVQHCPLVTVMSFGGPRVGNLSFRHELELQGTKVLRIVNSDDLITKVPGFVVEDGCHTGWPGLMPNWIQKKVEETQWVYAEVGMELRLRSSDSPYLEDINVATCHDLKTYLHLVEGFVSSSCPFRSTARRLLGSQN
uniref:Fungal lipase-type domain-containing protein n=1 Tax=Kalanchoe fedtschenkoi TaxID=63787 RepID=A0A7N0ZR62_KALFE